MKSNNFMPHLTNSIRIGNKVDFRIKIAMDKAVKSIQSILSKDDFIKCVFSSPRDKSTDIKSLNILGINNKNEVKIELRLQKHNDIKTIQKSEFLNDIRKYLKQFKQCLIKSETLEVQVLLNKKFSSKIITKQLDLVAVTKKHNRAKQYLIPDGAPCSFLIAIGVMDSSGKVKSNYYKKFKQINRFLELVDDLYRDENAESLHAVDFGCGKSYLTFALYHYFSNIKKINIKITGIDLKQEVIDHCNSIAQKINFDNLNFVHGFIHDFKSDQPVDFVVTLHACDTATDDAIIFSLLNNAKKMMFVPCCQHELNKQISNPESTILLKHGIFRDRMTALVTDTMRSQLLEACSFKVQTMEFIDLEHTAKNILLRCTLADRSPKQIASALDRYHDFKNQWKIKPYLETKLIENNFLPS